MKITIFLLFVFFIGCSTNKDNITESISESEDYIAGSVPAGAFTYKAFNSNGNLIINGWLKIEFIDSDKISGKWNFQKVGNPKDIGPHVGEGNLIGGRINQDSIWIELNPQFKDNNLQLHGKYTSAVFSGQWLWISLIGITNQGYFEAEMK